MSIGNLRIRLSMLCLLASTYALSASAGNTLPQLISEALRTHPSLTASASRVDAAQAGVESARWGYWPTPSLTFEQADAPAVGNRDERVAIFSLKQPLWTNGQLDASVATAEADQHALLAGQQETRRNLVLEVIGAFADAYGAQERLTAHQHSFKTHDHLLEQVRRRTRGGLSTLADVTLAQSRRETAHAAESLALTQFRQALAVLHELSDQPMHTQTALIAPRPFGLIAQVAIPEQATFEQAQANDPTLTRLTAEAAQLAAEVDSSRASFWPEVYARLDQQHGDVTGDDTRILVGIESNWGAGLSNLANATGAEHRRQAKQGDIHARRRELSRQIRTEIIALQNARERSATLQTAYKATLGVAQSWDRQFLAGKKTWQDVMNAVREVTNTQTQLADARASEINHAWRLMALTQGIEQMLETIQP